jgi:hypothetical protein
MKNIYWRSQCSPGPEAFMGLIDIITNAPTNYDGFSAKTVQLPMDRLEKGFRRVRLDGGDLEWQMCRYHSGLFACALAPRLWALWNASATEAGSTPVCVLDAEEILDMLPTVGSQAPKVLEPGMYTSVYRQRHTPSAGYYICTLWPQREKAVREQKPAWKVAT